MTTDVPICGYAQITGLCHGPRMPHDEGSGFYDRCTTHMAEEFRFCVGCGGVAIGECQGPPEVLLNCTLPLCRDCVHHPDASHSRELNPEGAFRAQRPSAEPAQVARTAMLGSLEASLRAAAEQGLLEVPGGKDEYYRRIAGVLLDDLAAEVLMKTFVGMAAGQAGS